MTSPGTSHLANANADRLSSEEFWRGVQLAYEQDTVTRGEAITNEVAAIRSALARLVQPPWERYTITDFLGVGGAGVVFQVWDSAIRTNRALKLARPIDGKEALIAGLLSEEISHLQEVSHPNVIPMFDAGELESAGGRLPFFTMALLRGALPARKYFETPRPLGDLFECVAGILRGVQHLHQALLVHLDLKPSNIFVGAGGTAIVADLGGARRLDGEADEQLVITCTTDYAHPTLRGLTSLSTGGDDNRRRGLLRRSQLGVGFDLYAAGRTLLQIVRAFEASNPKELPAYTRKYLLLLAARLLDGHTGRDDRPLGLTEASLSALKYLSIDEAVFDFDKLLGRANPLELIPELSSTNDRVIQVVRNQRTPLTDRVARLLSEPLVRRLATVTQLGLVRLVYPGATHSRLEHSLGAFSNAAQYLAALYNDPINPLFRQIVRVDDLVATLLAAFLHDLGQYQHAHDLDDVEPKVFRHETLTLALLKGTFADYLDLTDSLRHRLRHDWSVAPDRVVAILEAQPDRLTSDIRDRLLHTIVSGPLDVDKLDYLKRDSNHCGTVFGRGIDRSRLLATLTVVYEQRGQNSEQYFALGIHEKGRAAAESLAFARYQMFQAVYWHHAVRSAKAMIQRAAYEWIAPKGPQPAEHDRLKGELYDFILRRQAGPAGQGDFFAGGNDVRQVGELVQPDWSHLIHTDLLAIEWLNARTSDVGKRILQALTTRRLYKRIFVIAKSREPSLWRKIQDELGSQEQLRLRSEELRRRLKERAEQAVADARGAGQRLVITGIGEAADEVARAIEVLGLEGALLLDGPRRRGPDTLRFYPEELYRGQREDFQNQPVTVVSEIWRLLGEQLHETAGSYRVFINPDVDILRKVRTVGDLPILGPMVLEEEVRSLFDAM